MVSFITTLVCLIVLYAFNLGLVKHEFSSERDRYGYIARNEAEHIVTTIDCVMARTNTLKAMIQDHNGDTSFFNDVAESVYNDVIDETGVTLKNFALAPDGVVSDVYPLEGNEALIGFDFLDISRLGNLEAKEAYEQGSSHVMHAKGSLDDQAVRTQFHVRNLTWELAVSPQKGWISGFQVILSTIIILIISGLIGLFTNVMLKLRENNAILYRLSNTDQLTGGLNRMAYGTAISDLSSGSIDDDFVYVSVDLNGLKQTNDSLGHMAGDELIDGASRCLCDVLGAYGRVYRIGGDEFAALIHTKGDSIDGIIDKLNTLVNKWQGRCVQQLSLSVGYASHKEFPEARMESLIRTADKRMYDAKRAYYLSAGKDRRS